MTSKAQLKMTGHLQTARETLGDKCFSSSEFAQLLNISERSAQRYLAEAMSAGNLERTGQGPSSRYRIVTSS